MSCTFNSDWMNNCLNPQFYPWFRSVDSPRKAMCSICNKMFALYNMGKCPVKNQMQREKHQRNTHEINFYYDKYLIIIQNHVCVPAKETG